MTLTIVWHKPCWVSSTSPTGFAALGGLPRQIAALSERFDATRIVGPRIGAGPPEGETALAGRNVTVVPLTWLPRDGWRTWARLPIWLIVNGPTLVREIARADAVYPLIPSPIGILGLLIALLFRKRLVTRQLNSWSDPRRFWRMQRALLERIAGGRHVVFATGGDREPPSRRNPSIRWLFSSTILESELAAGATPRRLDPRGPVRLIIAGREVEVAATLLLLNVLTMLAPEFPDMTLDVVGNGEALAKSRRIAGEMSLTHRVTFHGPVGHARMFELLRHADLYCLSGVETESFRQTVHEALAVGLPIVAARSSVLPMIAQTECGIFVDEKTPDALAGAIRSLLADPERYSRMSADALQTAKPYTLERWRDTMTSAMKDAWGPLQSMPGADGVGAAATAEPAQP